MPKNYNSANVIVCPLLIFSLNFYTSHNFQTIKAVYMKSHTLIEHIMEKCDAQEP